MDNFSFNSQGNIDRRFLETLLGDINYCIKLLYSTTTIEIPSMRVTKEGIFFAGQYFDALLRITEIIKDAQQTINIIDGYIDIDTLDLLKLKRPEVKVNILTKNVNPPVKVAAQKFNYQYGKLSIRSSDLFHDRFIIIDEKDYYHFGASIKDLGNRGFMFSRIEEPEVMNLLLDNFKKVWSLANIEV
jgi:hypothetical protein